MTYRKKLTLSFFLILSFQTLLSIGFTSFSFSGLLKGQNRTILEEGWNQQVTRFNDIFKQITKDLYFYKFLIEEEIGSGNLDNVDHLLEKCLDNTVAHTTILYDSEGTVLISKNDGQQLKDFNILNSPYSLLDFRFPNTRIAWSNKEDPYDYFGLISGTRILSGDTIYYLLFFTDFRQHLQQISERQPEVLTVFSLGDRILYSDFPGVTSFDLGEKEWGDTRIGNDTFMVYGQSIWSNKISTVTLSVLHTITEEKKLMNTLIRMTAFIFSFTWVIAFIIALWVSRIFSIPLISLNNSLKTYMTDGFFPQIEYKKENEFSFLIKSFENLSDKIVYEEKQIRSQMEEIQVLNDYNRNLIENMKSGIVVLSFNGTVEFCNTFFSRTIDRDYGEIIGCNYRQLLDDVFDIEIPGLDTIKNFSIIPGIHLLP
ncbi:MAG: hypothetical protein PF518_12740 [Spirochaetaceae bacterium]|jgi:translation initiation factor 2 beta subunit (eIF-2beta)/eIF-5|nr:hypothetical protein [Spirochaetaceae bacterium]